VVGIPFRTARTVRSVLALACAAAVLSACGSTSAKSSSDSSAPVSSPTALYQTYENAAQSQTPTAYRELGQAFVVATGECMRSKGFVYYDEQGPPGGPPFVSAYEHPYSSLAKREISGYGLYNYYVAQEGQGSSSQDLESSYIASLSPAKFTKYVDALEGPPGHRGTTFNIVGFGREDIETGGCQGRATREIFGTTIAGWYAYSLTILPTNQLDAIEKTRSFREFEAKWSECMTKDGYSFSSPSMAISSLEQQYQTDGPTAELHQREITIAVADYRCATATGFKSVYDAALRRSVTSLSPQDKVALAAASRDLGAALRRAQRFGQ
jgi:ABC-type uncharacterized transport system auxiliary subunit